MPKPATNGAKHSAKRKPAAEVADEVAAEVAPGADTAPPAAGLKPASKLSSLAAAPASSTNSTSAVLAALRLDQSYTDPGTAVEDLLLQVEIRKPQSGEFVRVHPDYRFDTQVVDRGMAGGIYLLTGAVLPALADHAFPVALRLYVTIDGKVGVWPLKLPRGDKPNIWNVTAMQAAQTATEKWVSLQSIGTHYVARAAVDDLGPPKWPTQTWEEILGIAIMGRVIEDLNHVVAKKLIGKL